MSPWWTPVIVGTLTLVGVVFNVRLLRRIEDRKHRAEVGQRLRERRIEHYLHISRVAMQWYRLGGSVGEKESGAAFNKLTDETREADYHVVLFSPAPVIEKWRSFFATVLDLNELNKARHFIDLDPGLAAPPWDQVLRSRDLEKAQEAQERRVEARRKEYFEATLPAIRAMLAARTELLDELREQIRKMDEN